MTLNNNHIVPPFDFTVAQQLSVDERIQRSLEMAHKIIAANDYQSYCHFPCVPTIGASDTELCKLEAELGRKLPTEYRAFLSQCRYLKIDDGLEIGGFDHKGIYVTEIPWISNDHQPSVEYLVFANYWNFADGDQLMFDMNDPKQPVIAYLHEHGPLFEMYAPSFSLALWRLVHEKT